MERWKYISIGCCIVSSICGACSDMLDVMPKNSVTFKDALDNEREIEVALGSVESAIKHDIFLESFSNYPEIYGWINDGDLPGGGWTLEQSNSGYVFMSWSQYYRTIMRANLVLPYLDQVSMEQKRRDFYLGQIYFFKAFCYYRLALKWGDVPYIHTEVELEAIPKRPTVVILDSAIIMAERAAHLLPDFDEATHYDGSPLKYRSTPSKGAAYTLLAYLCAWKAGTKYLMRPEYRDYDEMNYWKRAEDACCYVIDSCKSYSLAANPEEVCTEVLKGDSREGIFETVIKDFWQECSTDERAFSYSFFAKYFASWPLAPEMGEGENNPNYYIGTNTIESMYTGNDARKEAYFYRKEGSSTWHLYKWRYAVLETTPGSYYGTFQNINENVIWFRLADVILLRGECRARLGNDAGAIEDINRIRDRAGAERYKAYDYPGKDVRYAVFREREKELLLEGFRWFDIIRNNYIREELKGNYKTVSREDLIDGCMFLGVSSLAFERNTLMRQNVYWLKKF